MVFSSTVFLLLFLPLVAIAYYLCPRRGRNVVLLLASLLFYGWGEPKYILIMLFSTVFDYCNGLGIGHFRSKGKPGAARAVMILSVVGNLSILGFFKYTDFAIGNVNSLLSLGIPALGLALPIGISFYTFQTMSYTIDVYRGQVAPQRNILDFGAYVTLFPQLIAGPIVQYKTVEHQLHTRRENWLEASRGLQRFVIGLGKKVLIANQVGALWETVSAMDHPAALTAWLGALAFTFQIYFDFSGYSDMAIGLGHLFGFTFLENFRYPYESRSVTEFWRRWHISLGTWFREYVYIPLGGNRRGTARQILNLAIVWFLTGLWHGASWNFVLWGVYYAVLLILEKTFLARVLERLPRAAGHIYTCFCFVMGWVLFAITDFGELGRYVAAMFTSRLADGGTWYLLRSNAVLLVLALIGSTMFPVKAWEKLSGRLSDGAAVTLRTVGVTAILLLSVAFLVGDSYNPFLYFRF
ncbi:MAG: MBOAT family protein [Oscillospiraceae bacterium]|nr:MBOAT family protein [Oscillospiraceae bacterium]MBQ6117393.1 MBOAT family protein [Oscillospiraceae bacterium]